MKGAAWRGHGGLSAADHLGAGALAAARRARLCIYGVALAFGAFAAFLAFAPSLPAPPPSSPSAAWLDGVLASASPYRAQVSGFFSSLFPANSSSFSPGPPGPGVLAARRSGPGGSGLAVGGGRAGTNGSSAVRPREQSGGGGNSGGVRSGNSASSNATAAVGARTNGSSPGEQSGGGGGVPGGNSGGVRTDNSAAGNAAASAVRSDAPPSDHAGGGEAASNSSGIAAAAPNKSSGTAAAEAKSGATIGGSAQNGTTAQGAPPIQINGSEVNASSAEATAINGTAIPSVNQTRSAVSAMLHGNVAAAPHRRGHPGKNHTAQDSAAHHNQQQTVNRAAVASGGSNSTKTMHKEATAASQVSAGLVQGHAAQATNSSAVPVMGNRHPAKEAANAGGQAKKLHSIEAMGRCDMFYGNWVRDDSYPLYPEGSCPHVDESFNCHLNGRPDKAYQRLRWQPRGCSIPRLNPTDMLERLRGKRLVFVGDSLNRNMWESLVCILRNSVKDKRRVFEVSGNHKFRAEGSYSFLFQDYNCTVEFFRSPFLVQEWDMLVTRGKKKETLRLDKIDQSSSRYKNADVIVFNTGHWWTHEKTSLGKDYYQEGNQVYSQLNVHDAYRRALNTWARWVDSNINPKKTTVFFRGYSASHFSGGQWNSGGSCDKETEPITNKKYLMPYPQKMSILEEVLHGMKTPVAYLNITRMTDYRKEGHPSVYRKQKLSGEERKSPELYQDCSHWCLPGVPDSWNELLYAQILVKQHQMLHQ
ncbi:hypothetical protein CFC21_089398 [Triticum aestivum]|uniref:Uncharacterized protein n=2 Tax=Triticum aestivum TaxID=4565 RepID=A0A3B6PSL9_WHEAT|nr:protein trichome birefringence-like 1 [Triticum aestivum]KAF7086042.1 hypothetical protein CFC21_089398 [Triticum aestivum]